MFKSKSFALNSDGTIKKPETLYQPRKIRWLKYILYPLVVGFMILLIVSNVSFARQSAAGGNLGNISIFNASKCCEYAENHSFANGTVCGNSHSGLCLLHSLATIHCAWLETKGNALDQCNIQALLDLQLNYTHLAIEQQHSEHPAYSPGDFFAIQFELSNSSFITLRPLDLSGKETANVSKDFSLAGIRNFTLNLANNILDCVYGKLSQTNPCRVSMVKSRNLLRSAAPEQTQTTPTKRGAPPLKTSPRPSTQPTRVPADPPVTQPVETTPISPEYEPMMCFNAAQEAISSVPITYNVTITVIDDFESGLKIALSGLDFDSPCRLVYFAHGSDYSQVDCKDSHTAAGAEISIDLGHFHCDTSYVVCLLVTEVATSPFTCQSYHTAACGNLGHDWFHAHSVLIVSLGFLGILLCVALGLLAMYGVLCLRPTWLRGSKRLLRAAPDAQTMLLMSRIYEKEIYGTVRNEVAQNGNGECRSAYRHLEKPKLSLAESNKYILPPEESAPTKPAAGEPTQITTANSYTYASFELYEELI